MAPVCWGEVYEDVMLMTVLSRRLLWEDCCESGFWMLASSLPFAFFGLLGFRVRV